MAPTAVLFKLTSTTDTMNTTTNNTLWAYTATSSAVNSVSLFGTYQDTAVGCELTIRTIVPPDISDEPYRKAMVAIFFLSYSFSHLPPSIAISNLTATVAASFAMPTDSAEREAERIVESVRHAFFDIGNLQGIGFLDSSGKAITVSDHRTADITSFSFVT